MDMHLHTYFSSCYGWSLSHSSGRFDGCIWWTSEYECIIRTIWKVNNFSALLISSLWSIIPQKVQCYVLTFNPLKTGESEITFQASASQFWKESCFLKVPRFHPLVRPLIATCKWRWAWSIGGMKLAGGNWSTQRKTCPVATLSTTNIMEWPGIQCRCPLWEASNYIP